MGLLQEQNRLKESDPAFPKDEVQNCENEAVIDKADCVDMGEEGTKDSEVIDQEV